MLFNCYLTFKKESSPFTLKEFGFLMRARSFDGITEKMLKASEAPIFSGWIIETVRASAVYRMEDLDETLRGCLCTYSNKGGFKGTVSTYPPYKIKSERFNPFKHLNAEAVL